MRTIEGGRSDESMLRPVAKTVNPSAANPIATPRPTPRDAPVTSAAGMQLSWANKERKSTNLSDSRPVSSGGLVRARGCQRVLASLRVDRRTLAFHRAATSRSFTMTAPARQIENIIAPHLHRGWCPEANGCITTWSFKDARVLAREAPRREHAWESNRVSSRGVYR
jgi:hypothetical protein